MNNVAYISLGSNVGNREQYLKSAIQLLNMHPAIQVCKISSIYETEPVGYEAQDTFLNMVIELYTTLAPIQLLQVTSGIENQLGRIREERWGPRTVDLDILLYNAENMRTEKLTIPHPRMLERGFVIIPLREVLSTHHTSFKEINAIYEQSINGDKGVEVWRTCVQGDVSELFGN
ncbi:MAG: 2-amino-4-hydroxy-6-hydroxymethyldihydropteridine diphosphokinase [Bacilli bacterium]